jgi:putative ABC transport system substrate-binding protein
MRRRNVLAILGLSLLGATPVDAQQRRPRVGFLGGAGTSMHDRLKDEMARLGYHDGKTMDWMARFVDGGVEPMRTAALELIKQNVDLIIAGGTSATLAAKSATSRIPIVAVSVTDPEGLGIVDRLARPLANVTGIGNRGEDLGAKRIDILAALVPVKRLAWFINAASDGNIRALSLAQEAVRARNITLLEIPVRDAAGIDAALDSARRQRMDAMLIPLDAMLTANRKRFADFALANRIPSVGAQSEFVQAGGLSSYGQDQGDMVRLAVGYVDRLLKGAAVKDLPFQRADKIELWLNAKTARSINVTIPRELLARADSVLE